jgi:hypothetical protein
MSLSNEIISLLSDEASLTLCRKSPKQLEGSQQERLARIDALQDRLQSMLYVKLRDYLREESVEYRHDVKVLSAITAWEKEISPYGDRLEAFAAELKNASRALAASKNLYAAFDFRASAMAPLLRLAAEADSAVEQLNAAAHNLGQVIAETIYNHEKVRVSAPPFTGLVQWVKDLASRLNIEALVDLQARETEVRTLLANQLLPLRSQATLAREAVADAQQDYFYNYWDDLRAHALTNYVKDRDANSVLQELTARYLSPAAQNERSLSLDEPALLFA